jgi:chromosome segregation ATPase
MTTRRELTFAACDALAAQGIKPAMSAVRKWTYENGGGKRGSDPDVQGDINAWYEALLQLKKNAHVIPGMPEHVAAQALQLWVAAREAALDTLDSERAAVEADSARMQRRVHQAEEVMAEAQTLAREIQHQLDVSMEKIDGLQARIVALEAAASEQRAVLAAKEERITGLTEELGRKTEAQATLAAEIEGVHKHTLLQIDTARGEARHWKSKFERVDAENRSQVEQYRQRAAQAETELASVRGRLEAVEAELTRRIASESAALQASVAPESASRAQRVRSGLAGKQRPRLIKQRS